MERQALRYETEFLPRMIPIPLDEQAGLGDTDSVADSGMEVEEEFEVDDDLADISSQVFSPFNFRSQLTGARANSFQHRLLLEVRGKPSPFTPHCRLKWPPSPSVHLTPSMVTRVQKRLWPTQRRNYKV